MGWGEIVVSITGPGADEALGGKLCGPTCIGPVMRRFADAAEKSARGAVAHG